MGRFQIGAIAICVLLNALDGFDVLAISFASPGIAEEWGVERGVLGVVLSMELIGMGVGSLTIGALADRAGRRPVILLCLVMMAAGMWMAASAGDLVTLSAYRLLTGLGIGGMLAAINAMAAEYANLKYRNLCVIIMATGYPAGIIVGGAIAAVLLANFDWRSVFLFGGAATTAIIPVVWLLLPESIEYLSEKRPKDALARINATLQRMGHAAVQALPAVAAPAKSGLRKLFSKDLVRVSMLLTAAYFCHIMTFYFIMKWIPKIVADMGFSHSAASGVLVWANIGGTTGALLLGLFTQLFSTRHLVIVAFVGSAVMVSVFGQGQADLFQLSLIAAFALFFANAAIIGLYALIAESFPTEVRAGGTGLVIGVGRAGAALGPIIAGFMFQANLGLDVVALVMAFGSLLSALALFAMRRT